jgi:methylphosphotriester-DNA--protein-cysteine methyltransferase
MDTYQSKSLLKSDNTITDLTYAENMRISGSIERLQRNELNIREQANIDANIDSAKVFRKAKNQIKKAKLYLSQFDGNTHK